MLTKLLRSRQQRNRRTEMRRRSLSRTLRTESLEGRRLLAADVWINEFHYDNAGGDTGEFIEVAGPAGTDLTGWNLVLYNGSNGQSYSTIGFTETIDDEAGTGFGAISKVATGLQNGAPDGIALVDDTGAVIQFLSYEGAFAATNGPASGMTSVDVGVAQSGSDPSGQTLQLKGVGTTYANFTWTAPSSESPGSLNDGQSIAGAGPGILVTVTGSGNDVAEAGPTSDSFSVELTQQPSADVTITVSSVSGQITFDTPTTLVFTSTNWDQAQTVTFTAIDDAVAESDHTDSVAFVVSSSDVNYNGFSIPSETINISDNDFGVLIPTVINEFVADHTGTDTQAFAELLTTPNANLGDLTLLEIEGDSATTLGFIDKIFPLGTADANGYLVVNSANGFDPENGAGTLLLVYGFTGSLAQDLDTNDDGIVDVTPWLSIVDSVGFKTNAGEFVYSPAVLQRANINGVNVFGGASRIPNGVDTDSPSDWVSNDFSGEGLVGLGGIAPPGQAINTPGLPNQVKPGVNVMVTDGSTAVVEGGMTDTLSIALFSQPTADVTVTLNPGTQLLASPLSVTFTSANWNVPQTVTVSAVDDLSGEGSHTGAITFAVTSSDADYNSTNVDPISVDITDNDLPGVVIAPTAGLTTTEAGGTATFTVRLASPPTANVTMSLTSSDTTEGTVSASSLTFTPANWNVDQTVTVTGVDDVLDDGNIAYSINTGNTVSLDFNYEGVFVEDVQLTNIDNDFNQSGLINEVLVNPPDADGPFEYVELRGDSGSSLDGFYFVQIEGDGGAAGSGDFVVPLAGSSFGSNGLLIIKSTTGGHVPALGTTIVTASQLDASGGGLENGSVTSLLIYSPSTTIVQGQDYDTNNDGILDGLPADAIILDSVGWTDGDNGDWVYSSAALQQSSGTPDAATRFPSDLTANSASAWYAADLQTTAGSASLDYEPARATTPIPNGAVLTPGNTNFGGTPVQQFAMEASVSNNEGSSGTTNFVFNVLRLGDSSGAALVDYTFTAGSTDAADFGGILPTGGQITFADGQSVATITIAVSGDTTLESDESFDIALVATSIGVVLQGANVASGTIINDDSSDAIAPSISNVFITSTAWSPAFIDTIDGPGVGNGFGVELTPGLIPLPWNNVNRIVVQFSEDVVGVSTSTLQLLNSNGPLPITVSYDAINFRATVGLSTPLTLAKLRFAVADSITDAAGNQLDGDNSGAAGGIYNQRFNIVAGDANGDGRVSGPDLATFGPSFNSQVGQANFNPRLNWNGDDRVNGADLTVFSLNFNVNVANLNEPPPPFGGGGQAAAFGFPQDEFFKELGFDDDEKDDNDNSTHFGGLR